MISITLHLQPTFFSERERILVESGALSATAFLFDSGVPAVRLRNERGELTLLPFQGQQVWSAVFDGRALTMRSMFSEPRPTTVYLETYGGFLLHCGATAMGVPSAEDTHPLHGELPNAPYQTACLLTGEDALGPFMALSGCYQHTVAFNHNYQARPEVRLHAGQTRFQCSMTITNLKKSEMELMYMAHVNFRPVDGGRLVYSAPCDPAHVRVRRSIPSHIQPRPGYQEFIETLGEHPELHNHLKPDLLLDPEVVFTVDYLADADGWAHSLQIHPDGRADYIGHRPAQLDKGIRWISRTPDQDALGLVLPATAEPEGYLAEKSKGNLKVLPPGGQFRCDLEIGALDPPQVADVVHQIETILSG